MNYVDSISAFYYTGCGRDIRRINCPTDCDLACEPRTIFVSRVKAEQEGISVRDASARIL